MLNRRGFIGTLFASIVGAKLAPSSLLWTPSPEPELPPVAPGALLTLSQIVRAAAIELSKRAPLAVACEPGQRIGDAGMTRQLCVDLALPEEIAESGLDARHYIEPAVACLAQQIKFEGWRHYGQLALPRALDGGQAAKVTSVTEGVSIRGVLLYEPAFNYSLLRLDVLGGPA